MLQTPTDFMMKTSKDKSKHGNQPETLSYLVWGVFMQVKWFFVFSFLSCFSFQSAGRTCFEFSARHLTYPFQLNKDLAYFVSLSPRGCPCLHLRFIPVWIASLPLKELLLSGRALLENVPYTLTPLTFTLLILHWCLSFTPGKFMCKAEASPSNALNEWQSGKKKWRLSHKNLNILDGYPGHLIDLK